MCNNLSNRPENEKKRGTGEVWWDNRRTLHQAHEVVADVIMQQVHVTIRHHSAAGVEDPLQLRALLVEFMLQFREGILDFNISSSFFNIESSFLNRKSVIISQTYGNSIATLRGATD